MSKNNRRKNCTESTGFGRAGGAIREWLSIFMVKYPKRFILLLILFMNVILWVLAALLISALSPKSLAHAGFLESIFYTISMILDAGCIQYVVADIGEASVLLIIVCLVTILLGMISFTGAVIGYVTNTISDFINNSKTGKRALVVAGHTVILNWNSRASEIINDMVYRGHKEVVVVLVPSRAEEIEKEIYDRIDMTLRNENRTVIEKRRNHVPGSKRHKLLTNKLTIIVREGDTFSTKQLQDISIRKAKSVIILGRDAQNSVCRYEMNERLENTDRGNSYTVKTLIQVAEQTGSEESADNQVIIVEIDDYWTGEIVNKIIERKERQGKSKIVPVPVNIILGQLLSQFSIMPELNFVYDCLFSNKGASFFCKQLEGERSGLTESQLTAQYLNTNAQTIPLTVMDEKQDGKWAFFVADRETDCRLGDAIPALPADMAVYDPTFNLEQRNIIIVGHNSNCLEIMDGFNSFRTEWNNEDGSEILNIIVIDDKRSLERRNYYRDYPYVRKCVEADIYDADKIKDEITRFVDSNKQDTSVLILSDDMALADDVDANALTYLIYVQEVINEHIRKDKSFDRERIDVIVEIVNPKNEDVVRSYSVDNVVISNKYISKVITQLGIKEPLYDFYKDILTYDDDEKSDSKELYIKEAGKFLKKIPGPCSASDLIRAVYDATPDDNKSIVMGYVRPDPTGEKKGNNQPVLFSGDLSDTKVELQPKDKLILFSNH